MTKEKAVNVTYPVQLASDISRKCALGVVEMLGLKGQDTISHPDFIGGITTTPEDLLHGAFSAVFRKGFVEGSLASAQTMLDALDGPKRQAINGGIHGNAAV